MGRTAPPGPARFPAEFDLEDYSAALHFDTELLAFLADFRHDHTRLGYAVQLVTLKALGTFQTDPTDVPDVILGVVAQQLGLKNPRDPDTLPRPSAHAL